MRETRYEERASNNLIPSAEQMSLSKGIDQGLKNRSNKIGTLDRVRKKTSDPAMENNSYRKRLPAKPDDRSWSSSQPMVSDANSDH